MMGEPRRCAERTRRREAEAQRDVWMLTAQLADQRAQDEKAKADAMQSERDASLAREAALLAALHLGVQLVEQDYLESAAGWDSFYSCAVDALGNHPTDERIDRAGTCETCSKPIYEGDQYAPCTDGAMLCFNHAPLYSDLQKQYAQCVADDIGDGDCVDAEEMVENLAIITRRIAEHGDGKVVYIA